MVLLIYFHSLTSFIHFIHSLKQTFTQCLFEWPSYCNINKKRRLNLSKIITSILFQYRDVNLPLLIHVMLSTCSVFFLFMCVCNKSQLSNKYLYKHYKTTTDNSVDIWSTWHNHKGHGNVSSQTQCCNVTSINTLPNLRGFGLPVLVTAFCLFIQ